MARDPKQNDKNTSVWFCVKYNENISNRLIDDKEEQSQKIESIYKKNQALFIHNKDYNKINYFSRIINSDDYNYFSEIVMNISDDKDIILLQPEYENFSDRSTTLFDWSITLIIFSNFALFFRGTPVPKTAGSLSPSICPWRWWHRCPLIPCPGL